MCSRCEPDGLRGEAVKEELLEIHEIALVWAAEGWFTYEVDWDAQAGTHWISVDPGDDGPAAHFSLCEFQAFIRGLEAAARRGLPRP